VDKLVVGALQEGRVDCAEGLDALHGQTGGEGHLRVAVRVESKIDHQRE